MIFDIIRNRHQHISLRGLRLLLIIWTTDFSTIEAGCYEIDGDNLFVLVQKYNSVLKEIRKWECHQKNIDIQFIAEGIEQLGYRNIDKMKVNTGYISEKDISILSGEGDYITVSKDSYGIFFPDDVHQPKLVLNNVPGQVKKVVIKIKVD